VHNDSKAFNGLVSAVGTVCRSCYQVINCKLATLDAKTTRFYFEIHSMVVCNSAVVNKLAALLAITLPFPAYFIPPARSHPIFTFFTTLSIAEQQKPRLGLQVELNIHPLRPSKY
jgi:hypothetical protein